MNGKKEYSKSYVFGLNQQIRMLKDGNKCHRRLIQTQALEIVRLRNVLRENAKEILALERVICKVKRWYQIIIWKR